MLADLLARVKHDYSPTMINDSKDTEIQTSGAKIDKGAIESSDDKEHSGETLVAAAQNERRVAVKNGEEVVQRELCARARSAHERLRTILTGRVLISLQDLNRSYLFNWNSAQASIEEIPAATAKEMLTHCKSSAVQTTPPDDSANSGSSEALDCYITLSDRDMYRIYRGDLNPQIAMLSDKIEVGGKLSFAVYLFNLVAPRMN